MITPLKSNSTLQSEYKFQGKDAKAAASLMLGVEKVVIAKLNAAHAREDDKEILTIASERRFDRFSFITDESILVKIPSSDIELNGLGLSEDFTQIMQMLFNLGFNYIQLDEQGSLIDGFPIY